MHARRPASAGGCVFRRQISLRRTERARRCATRGDLSQITALAAEAVLGDRDAAFDAARRRTLVVTLAERNPLEALYWPSSRALRASVADAVGLDLGVVDARLPQTSRDLYGITRSSWTKSTSGFSPTNMDMVSENGKAPPQAGAVNFGEGSRKAFRQAG